MHMDISMHIIMFIMRLKPFAILKVSFPQRWFDYSGCMRVCQHKNSEKMKKFQMRGMKKRKYRIPFFAILCYNSLNKCKKGAPRMNFQHMRYAVVIAETKSINKAAELLYVGQPTLSRAIKELEANVGITIFDRSAKGMFLTPDGEIFVRYAKSVLQQVENIENLFKNRDAGRKRFSVSVPRASYIAEAFARFSRELGSDGEAELFYCETGAMQTLRNLLQEDYKLGILRYAEQYDRSYKSMMEEKGLAYELVTEFRYLLLMSAEGPLARKARIAAGDLTDLIEIAHADPYVPSIPTAEVRRAELQEDVRRRIYVFERASQFELLSQNPQTFMWVSPVPKRLLERYGLVQRACGGNERVYKDVLVHRRDYSFSELDRQFIEQLVAAKREIIAAAGS